VTGGPYPRPVSASRPPLSVLDVAVGGEGATSADALAATTTLAQQAERLGYTRFWVAEHHNMATVASTAPSVLIAHLAASTTSIRVGSGGVMLPNHPPLVVAEHFAVLEALHPGRIDLGIGRAPGTDPETAAALRRSPDALGAEDFPVHLLELLDLLGVRRLPDARRSRMSATPVATSAPSVMLLGSSGYSAQVAGILGLPFAFAHHFDTGGTLAALELYRQSFEPSPTMAAPYAIVTANVLVAPTADEAEREAAPGRLMLWAIRTGRPRALPTPATALAHPDLAAARRLPTSRIVGTPDAVVARLDDLARDAGADELMVTTVAHGLDARVRSLTLLAEAWAFRPA
jgi:luciferase family oxidoreductase group 1